MRKGKTRADLDIRRRRSWFARSVVFVLTLVQATVRYLLTPAIGRDAPFATYYPAVMFAAWYIGSWPAWLMLIVGGLTASYCFIEPIGHFMIRDFPFQIGFAQYAAVGAMAIVLIELLHKSLIQVRQREESLLFSEERLRLAQQVAHLGTFDLDIASGRDNWTPEMEAIHGLHPGTFGGTRAAWEKLVHPEDRAGILQLAERVFATGESAESEWRVIWPDGSVHWIAGRWQVFKDANGTPVRATGANIDITNRKQRDADIENSRAEVAHMGRVAAIGEIAASIAHELNQPLAAIMANAEAAKLLLAKSPPPLDEVRTILTDICKDDGRAGDVILRMRAMLPKRAFESKPLAVPELIDDTLKLAAALARLRQTTINVQCDKELPEVLGDRIQLQQVLLNLVINGIEAMEGCPAGERSLAIAASRCENEGVQVLVTDRGPGIPESQRPILFEPFHTTKSGGMGMGLSIARSVIEGHGGRIWTESSLAGGATIGFLLPTEGETC